MKKYLFLTLIAATVGFSADAMMEDESPDKKGKTTIQKPLPSTAEKTGSRKSSQISSHISTEDPFKEALSEFSVNRVEGFSKMVTLAAHENIDALVFLGTYYSNGICTKFNGEEAIKNFKQALDLVQDLSSKASILNELGSVFYAIDDFEKAQENYKEAISLGSQSAQRNLEELKKEIF